MVQGSCYGSEPDYEQLRLDDAVPRLELRPGQCVVVTNGELLSLQGSLLLDRVFLRLRRLPTDPLPQMATRTLVRVLGDMPAKLYMTNCTLQGDVQEAAGGGPSRAMLVAGRVYAQGAPPLVVNRESRRVCAPATVPPPLPGWLHPLRLVRLTAVGERRVGCSAARTRDDVRCECRVSLRGCRRWGWPPGPCAPAVAAAGVFHVQIGCGG